MCDEPAKGLTHACAGQRPPIFLRGFCFVTTAGQVRSAFIRPEYCRAVLNFSCICHVWNRIPTDSLQLSASAVNVAALVRVRTAGFQPRSRVCTTPHRRAVDCAPYL